MRCISTFALLALLIALAPAALAQVDQQLQDSINSLSGLEGAGTEMMFSVEGIDVTIAFEGFAFCAPADPTLPPVSPAVVPNNVYGCENAAQVVGTPVADPLGVDLSMTIDPLFLDFTTARDRTILCGDLTSGTVTADAYATLSIEMSFGVRFDDQSGCERWLLDPGSTNLVLGSPDLNFDDGCLQTFAGLALGSVLPTLEAQLEMLMTGFVEDFLRQRNIESCGVAVESTSWAAVKAIYDSP